jgi:hypothetical protein
MEPEDIETDQGEIAPHKFVLCEEQHLFARGPHCQTCGGDERDSAHQTEAK